MKNSDELKELLRNRDLKATPTRLQVLLAIAASPNASSYSSIQTALENYDRITLYRTLNVLMDKGIVHKALTDENETYYALCSQNCNSHTHHHPHIHFKCEQCQEVSCVKTEKPIEVKVQGHQINSYELKATGVCGNCLG